MRVDFQGVSLLLTKSLYCLGSSKVLLYNLMRFSGLMLFSTKVDSEDDESDVTRMASVVTIVNSGELDEVFGINEDSVMTSVKLLLAVDF